MKDGLRILLVDDHSLVRDGVEAILQLEKDIRHIGHAASSPRLSLPFAPPRPT